MAQIAGRIAAIATRVHTPLGLAGLVMIVLYGLASQALKLDIFSNVGGGGTLQIIDGLLGKLFYLAILSICLGFVAYAVGLYLKTYRKPLESQLGLVSAREEIHPDTSQDDDPDHQAARAGGKKDGAALKISKLEQDRAFPVVDFKFQNSGHATAILWQFAVIVEQVEIDETPDLHARIAISTESFDDEDSGPEITVRISNQGWGTVRNCEFVFEADYLASIIPVENRRAEAPVIPEQGFSYKVTSSSMNIDNFTAARQSMAITKKEELGRTESKELDDWLHSEKMRQRWLAEDGNRYRDRRGDQSKASVQGQPIPFDVPLKTQEFLAARGHVCRLHTTAI